MRKVAGRLRLELAQYRELEAFAQFGSELDPQTQATLARGERMVATLNQPQYQPWPMEEQVVAIYAGINGFLDDDPGLPGAALPGRAARAPRSPRGRSSRRSARGKDLPDELAERLNAEIEKVKRGFNVEEPRASWSGAES